jgi:hypothetical protein
MPDLIISATGIGATLLACGVAIVLVILFHRAYQQQSAALRDGKIPRYAAYKTLSMTGARLALLVTVSSLMIAVVAVILLSAQAIYPRVFVFVGICLCIIVAPCLMLPRFLYDFLALLYVDGSALLEFQGTDLALGEAIAFSLRSVLFGQCANDRRYRSMLAVSLSSFLLLEALGMLFLLNLQAYLWVIPVLAVFLRILDGLTKNYMLKWIARAEQLEQTQWVALEPRIRQFAERAGVEIGAVRVHSMTRVGSAVSQVYGLRRPTLLLSDIFLKNSDWRQQDALIVIMLVLIKRRVTLINTLFSLAITATFWIIVVAFSSVLALLDAQAALSTVFPVLYNAYALFLILVVIKVFLTSKQSARFRSAMDLTGDPLAVLIAIHTSGLLTTTPPSRFALQSKRMRRLEQLARQPGPRAPWANRPVPSIALIESGSVALTVPLEQAPPSEPIAESLNSEFTPTLLSIFD